MDSGGGEKRRARRIGGYGIVGLVIIASVMIFLVRSRLSELSSVGYFGVFLLCFLSNATILLPAPSLFVAISAATVLSPVWVGSCAALGATAGEMTAYLFGWVGAELSPALLRIVGWLDRRIRRDGLFIFLLAFLPLPLFDFAGVYAGGKKMKWHAFALFCFAGKWLKMLLFCLAAGPVIALIQSYLSG